MLPTVVPGTEASAREVKALGEAIARGGRAVYEAAEEGILDPEIREMWKTMSRDTGVPVSINMNDVQFDAEWMDEGSRKRLHALRADRRYSEKQRRARVLGVLACSGCSRARCARVFGLLA